MSFLRSLFILSIFAGLVQHTLAAPKDWPVALGPSHEPDPVAFSPEMLKNVPTELLKRYPSCYLRAASWYLIEEDGTVETITHEIVRLNNRKGIDQLGEHRNVSFRPDQEKLTLNVARVIKANGTQVFIEPSHVQVRDVQTDYFVYDTTKEVIISFPSLEEGDIIETKWTTRGKNPEYAGQFFTRYQFGDERAPIWRELFAVRVPKGKTLRHAVTNPHLLPKEDKPEIVEKNGTKLFVWRANDRRPVVKEELLPSKEELRPGVVISTFASWDEVARWERKIRAHCWECTLDLKKIVEEVKREYSQPEEIARELTYWVRRNIRYVSLGDRHDFTPHPPSFICKNRFGDCKDGVQLLSVLLKEAGIPSLQISLNVVGDGQLVESVPSPLTNHAILLTTINGKDHWIDTTASGAGWDYLPKSDRDRLAYGVDDKSIRILRTPKMTAEDNRSVVVTRTKIDPDGTSHNVREMSFYGEAAVDKRDEWLDASDSERRRALRAELLDSVSKVKLCDTIDIDEKMLRRFHYPARARIEFDIPKQFQGAGEMEGSVADNSLWSRLLNASIDPERTTPIELKSPFDSTQTYIVETPLGYRLGAPPENRHYSSKWGAFSRTIEVADMGRRMTVVFHTRLERTRIEAVDFETFLEFQEKVSAAHRAYLSMKPSETAKEIETDIQSLEKLLAKDPKNPTLAVRAASLYLQIHQKEKAAKIVREARVSHAGDRELLELVAQTSDDLNEIEAASRALMKQFPDEAKYALDLAQNLIDVSEMKRAKELLAPLAKSSTPQTKASAYLLLAKISLETKDPKRAFEQINEAKLIDVDSADGVGAHRLDGEICEALNKDKQAIEAFKKALALDPKNAEILESLIRLNVKKGDKAEALNYLRNYVENGGQVGIAADWFLKLGRIEDAEELLPRDPPKEVTDPGFRVKGLIHFQRRQWPEAVKILSESIPMRTDQLHALMISNLMLGRLNDAISWAGKSKGFEETSAEIKRDVAAIRQLQARRDAIIRKLYLGQPTATTIENIEYFVCAEYLRSVGRPGNEVEPLVTRSLAGADTFGEALGLRAEMFVEKGQLTKALVDAEKAIRFSANEARGYYVRGRVLLERNQKGALEDLKRAVGLSGEQDASMLHWYAAGLVREKQFEAAIAAQVKAVRLRPGDAEIEEQMREIERVVGRK